MEVTLQGKRAVKVNAKKVTWGKSDKAGLYNIDGDEVWIPNSLHKFSKNPDNNPNIGDTDGTIIIVEWMYQKLFPNG